LADILGDSYKLAVDCSKTTADFIVFCGVYFMAEAADILSGSHQKVLIPEIEARCPMADQIALKQATEAFQKITELTHKTSAPVVYMNSTAEIKSFCGTHGGAVCTSSNADKIVRHFLEEGKIVFFAPDFNLGSNTADKLGLSASEIVKISPDLNFEGDISQAKMVIWDGFCYVHKRFTTGDIADLRSKYPNIRIIVHPECDRKVVALADDSGSTQKIYNEIKNSPDGSVWGVGTEYHFVQRIADEFPQKTILPLRRSICSNMAKITLQNLWQSLQTVHSHLKKNSALEGIVQVEEKIKFGAALALNKMIEIVGK